MEKVFEFFNNLLDKNCTVVVATSGGPDSMCLLYALNTLKDNFNLNIVCAHVNHNLRKESEQEKTFVENYSVNNNIIFEYMKIEKYTNNKFSEEEARRIRYKFFEDVVNKYNAKFLFTAHHGDDLIETILMRIVRGSNLKGFIGIPKIINKGSYKIIKPLLYVTKEDIIKYNELNNIPYVIDKSNTNSKYTRNRYRKEILPFLKEEDKNVHLKFLKFSEELENSSNYINSIIEDKYNKIVNNNIIDLDKYNKEEEFIKTKILERLIEDIQSKYIFDISKNQVNEILKLCDSKNGYINLSNNFVARKSYNKLYIEKNIKEDKYNYIFDKELIINNYIFKRIKSSKEKSNYIIRLNSEDIKLPIIIRSRSNGDIIKVKNLNGSKKVKDIFIDSKIDLEKRDSYPVVVDSNNEVLWIPGLKKSIFDKELSENYDIIIKCTEEK